MESYPPKNISTARKSNLKLCVSVDIILKQIYLLNTEANLCNRSVSDLKYFEC
jgi:hypothetical protein